MTVGFSGEGPKDGPADWPGDWSAPLRHLCALIAPAVQQEGSVDIAAGGSGATPVLTGLDTRIGGSGGGGSVGDGGGGASVAEDGSSPPPDGDGGFEFPLLAEPGQLLLRTADPRTLWD